ncbi:MAG TPA: NAD(P)/FAD-dependent oxidoreductase [Verrucomicrobiales bacterium]|nr:NAD(P)/FAD-dependent oxidoreductase [Verrucomicrobiales bacterium]
MKKQPSFDLLVIGGGSAGHAAAITASTLGLKAALVESAATLGGLCILSGCMPSKTLIETAGRMRIMREAGRFGIRSAAPVLDPDALRSRLASLIDGFRRDRVTEMESGRYALLRGSARFISMRAIELTDPDGVVTAVQAKAFVIAAGSHPFVPPINGLDGAPFWTSDDVVRLPSVPNRLAIIGSGAVGMECAHLFEGFGSQVTVIERGASIMSGKDPDIATALESESRQRGIAFLKDTRVHSVSHADGTFRLALEGAAAFLDADALLLATGRTPSTAGLGLEETGVAVEDGRILIDGGAATTVPHIFAAGDCASPVPVVHLAVIQGEVAARNAARLLRRGLGALAEWNRVTAMSAWFTEPQSVQVGLSESAAKAEQIPVIVGRQSYADHGKGAIAGSRHGFVKVLADPPSGRLLGAAAVGPQVVETSHLVQAAIGLRLTASDYLAIPHYHPTFTEAWSRAVEEIEAQRR